MSEMQQGVALAVVEEEFVIIILFVCVITGGTLHERTVAHANSL